MCNTVNLCSGVESPRSGYLVASVTVLALITCFVWHFWVRKLVLFGCHSPFLGVNEKNQKPKFSKILIFHLLPFAFIPFFSWQSHDSIVVIVFLYVSSPFLCLFPPIADWDLMWHMKLKVTLFTVSVFQWKVCYLFYLFLLFLLVINLTDGVVSSLCYICSWVCFQQHGTFGTSYLSGLCLARRKNHILLSYSNLPTAPPIWQ